MTKDEIEWGRRVRDLGCILCHLLKLGQSPCDLHHVREGRLGKRGKTVIGLCPPHHRNGPESLHGLGRKAFERAYGFTELDLLEHTKELLG